MRAICNRGALLNAFGMVSGIVPSRSPKPILQNVKLCAEQGTTSVLMGTDLEVGIRHEVSGISVQEAGSVILPAAQIGSILRTSGDDELAFSTSDAQLVIQGTQATFTLPIENASLFPEVPDFGVSSFHCIAASHLKKLIRRTIFATDVESARYALGGVLVELSTDAIAMVGTDGRRLARMIAPSEVQNSPAIPIGTPVIPIKALKLIERNLSDDTMQVHLTVQADTALLVRTIDAVIYTRLLEGRFPRYQDVFPSTADIRIPLEAGHLRRAIEQASIVTSDESRGVDFEFTSNALRLSCQAADLGSSHVLLAITYDGKPLTITFDPRYLIDALRALDDSTSIVIEMTDAKNAAVFRTNDGYAYVIMPLTRER